MIHQTPTVRLLGTRGVPAAHGGFETAAEHIGLELVRRGWRVVVYCQDDTPGAVLRTDEWRGIERVHVPARRPGAKGTVVFDLGSVRHAARHAPTDGSVCVTFGYNTAFLTALLRARGIPNVINMDGIEWKRACWSGSERAYLLTQERVACLLADHLIADHPEIRRHLGGRVREDRISVIAYGAPDVQQASTRVVEEHGLEPGRYLTLIARPVPENSVLQIVRAFSSRPWGVRLVVLGGYDRSDPFQRDVLDAASDEVVFPGAVYDADVVQALRLHSLAYVHGHRVGGTNPSLVEALGCGNPVLAHDNRYNRWVAGEAALYFSDEAGVVAGLEQLLGSRELTASLSRAARKRHAEEFTWTRITDQYEELLRAHLPRPVTVPRVIPAPDAAPAALAALDPVPAVLPELDPAPVAAVARNALSMSAGTASPAPAGTASTDPLPATP